MTTDAPETRPYDYDELVTRLEGIPEIQLSAFMMYIQFNLPPFGNYRGRGIEPKFKVHGALYVRIGRNRKNDREVSVTWYPITGEAPYGNATWPDVFAFPDFNELRKRFPDPRKKGKREIPEMWYAGAWAKVYHAVVAAPPEFEEMHTMTGYDEAVLKREIRIAARFVKTAPPPPKPTYRKLPLLDIDRMHEMTEYDK